MNFAVGDVVTPKSPNDVNFGVVGTILKVVGRELIVDFNGIPCLYFSWMVETYENA